MKPIYQITVEELEKLMRSALVNDGFAPCAVEGYVYAQKRYGWLRPSTKPETLAAAELFYTLPPADGFRDFGTLEKIATETP